MAARTNPAYRDRIYQANRAKVLAALEGIPPVCHWCRRRPATDADHLVGLAEGGTHDLDNLVPACSACNGKRGQRAAARARKPRPRRPAMLAPAAGPVTDDLATRRWLRTCRRFGENADLDPAASRARSLPAGPPPAKKPRRVSTNGASSARNVEPAAPLLGRREPRLCTRIPARTSSHARDVGRCWVRAGHPPLFAWQLLALAGILAVTKGPARRWLHRYALVTVGRQNGKSTILAALMVWWLADLVAERGAQVVVLVTHDLRLTTILFDQVAAALDHLQVLDGSPKLSHGRQSLRTRGGGRLYVATNAPNAGHGLSIDLAVVDETWSCDEAAVDVGLLPAQSARPDPLLVMGSTAGVESSTLLRRWRELGLGLIDTGQTGALFFAEWSPPPNADPEDPATWTWANPSLGVTIRAETLAAQLASPNRAAFLRGALNLWVATIGGWLPAGLWPDLARPHLELPAGGWLACDTSQDGERWVGVRAATDENGSVGLEVAFVAPAEPAFWLAVLEQRATTGCQVALTPGLASHRPGDLEAVTVGFAEVRQWTGLVRSAITSGAVWHRGQLSLAEQMDRAVASWMDGGTALSSAKSRGPIELARCSVFVVGLATRPPPPAIPQPAIY